MIPNIIHYVWVGDNKMPYHIKKIIENNEKYLKNFQIKFWDENNYDIKKNNLLKYFYAKKKWAFISDYIRFDVLYNYGGVYLDSDMELLRELDELLELNAFSAYNNTSEFIYCGALGCEKNNKLIFEVLKYYNSMQLTERFKCPTSPQIFTKIFKNSPNNNFKILDYKSFYPVPEGVRNIDRTKLKESFGIHHWDESWVKYLLLRRFLRRIGFIWIYHNLKRFILK